MTPGWRMSGRREVGKVREWESELSELKWSEIHAINSYCRKKYERKCTEKSCCAVRASQSRWKEVITTCNNKLHDRTSNTTYQTPSCWLLALCSEHNSWIYEMHDHLWQALSYYLSSSFRAVLVWVFPCVGSLNFHKFVFFFIFQSSSLSPFTRCAMNSWWCYRHRCCSPLVSLLPAFVRI